VHLQGIGEADANDHAVVKQVAAALTLANEPELGKGGDVVTLLDGIRFTAPPRFAPVPETDPNRTDRRLWPAARPGRKPTDFEEDWQSIETVGCLCPDFDPADAKQAERAKATLATLLLVRDSQWRGATVTSLGNRIWRADPPHPDEDGDRVPIAARAFLKTDPSGRALLTIVRGGIGEEGDFDGPWRQIEPTVQFLPAADVATLEDVGTTEAARLRRAGYQKLLADRDIEWWLTTSHDTFIGWSSTEFTRGGGGGGGGAGVRGKKQSHARLATGEHVMHVTHDFSYDDAAARYTSIVTREQVGPAATLKSIQTTTLADGKLSLKFDDRDRPSVQLWNGEPAPPQFVPGALLPLLIGQLSRDPMILQTDTFPGREGIGPPQPLTLIIRPGDNTIRTAPGDLTPLRCVTVQLNGAGTVSRWYFNKAGELQSVESSGGTKHTATDANVIKNTFPKESGMAP
jgi:hypothetical protein